MRSVKQEVLSGVFFTAVAKYANLVVSLGVTAILARLLAPDQFGVVAIAMVTISFLHVIADIGLLPAIIQYKELSQRALNILFSLSCYIAAGLSLLLFFGAHFIAVYYDQDLLQPIIQLLSISLFFSAIAVVPNALFYRERMFKVIAGRSFAIQLIGGTFAVAAAYLGAGIYALLINPILSSVLLFAISYSYFPLRFQFRFSIDGLQHVFRYSTFQFLFNFINYFSRNADTLMIGRYLGMSWLGYYDKAYQLMSLPLQNITQVITPVLHPILSMDKGHDERLLSATEQLVTFLALIGFPLSVFLYFSAGDLIFLFFGPQWGEAVPVFRVLSLTVGFQLVLSSSGSIFQSTGDTKYLFICGLFSATLNVGAIMLGIFFYQSIVAVATCLAVTFTVNFFLTYWLMYAFVLRASIWKFLQLLFKPVLFSILLASILYLTDLYIFIEHPFLRVMLHALILTGSFAIFIWYGGYRALVLQFIRRA